jgi:hypothetical protein
MPSCGQQTSLIMATALQLMASGFGRALRHRRVTPWHLIGRSKRSWRPAAASDGQRIRQGVAPPPGTTDGTAIVDGSKQA